MKEIRMKKLEEQGIDTSKYFGFTIENVENPVLLTIGGEKYLIEEVDSCYNDYIQSILNGIENNYVKNTKLHRRWVMAQTMRMLTSPQGWNEYVNNNFKYKYQFKMMGDEFNAQNHLKGDMELFHERNQFFNKETLLYTIKDYGCKLSRHIEEQKVIVFRNGKVTIYVPKMGCLTTEELSKKINEVQELIYKVEEVHPENVAELSKIAFKCYKDFIEINNALKCVAWKEAFKGSGAYYTLKNMIMFHNVKLTKSLDEAHMEFDINNLNIRYQIEVLNSLTENYRGEWFRLHALLKKVVQDNNFDLKERLSHSKF